jgi:stearoyl-CoA desaturase (Delta-9 desaturase)
VNALLDLLSHGLLNLSWVGIVIYTLVVTHITIVGVTVYLHRHSAHRAVDLHPALQHFFRFWLWMTTGMVTKEWTAIHRKHHAVCETEEDPHSPQVRGLNEILWRGAEAYRESSKQSEIMTRYGSGTPDDWMERNVYTRHSAKGVTALLILNIVLFGAIGVTIWAIQMVWIPFFAAGVINGIGHWWGYRNFECPDAATNISPWGIIIGGEELHNNHHTYPNSAKLSQKPWEFDIGWMWIRLFEICGLAKARSTGPVAHKQPGKQTLDLDTAWAVLNDRFRVMSAYADRVVKPLIAQEIPSSRSQIREAKATLCREPSLMDNEDKTRVQQLIASSPKIAQIYDLRMRLQDVWSKRGGNAEEMLQALKQWCIDAEATGIQTLRDFVDELRSYTTAKAAV